MPSLERGLACTVSRGIHDTFLSAVSFSLLIFFTFNSDYLVEEQIGKHFSFSILFMKGKQLFILTSFF